MKHIKTLATLSVLILFLACGCNGQSLPTATKQLDLSTFVAGTGTFTDFRGGKNLAITAGADLTYLSLRLFRPSIEVRGTYPIDEGNINSQKSILAGPKVEHDFGRFHPYADFLVGRGEIDYLHDSLTVCNTNVPNIQQCYAFLSTNTTVYSPGGGLDYELGKGLAIKGDIQYQHWNAPTVPYGVTGVVHPVAVSFGAVYHFNFDPHHHR